MNYLFVLIVLLSFNLTTSEIQNPKTLYLCKCESEKIDLTTKVGSKQIYIFLVEGEHGKDCCINNAIQEQNGFLEEWELQNGKVWAMDPDSLKTISSTVAQNKGCSLENRRISVAEFQKFPESFYKYYPNLKY